MHKLARLRQIEVDSLQRTSRPQKFIVSIALSGDCQWLEEHSPNRNGPGWDQVYMTMICIYTKDTRLSMILTMCSLLKPRLS